MAVAVEFVNVIIRKSAIERCFPDGLDGFARQELINLTEDDHLFRVGHMSGTDAFDFVDELKAAGLRHLEMDAASDIAVVWSGSNVPSWLCVGSVDGYSACWASDHPPGKIALPEPGFLLRCPRSLYNSLRAVVGHCGAELNEVPFKMEEDILAKLRCSRGPAEIVIDVWGDLDDDSPVGLWGCRQLARRRKFQADVSLIRDLVAALIQAGAEES